MAAIQIRSFTGTHDKQMASAVEEATEKAQDFLTEGGASTIISVTTTATSTVETEFAYAMYSHVITIVYLAKEN